MNAGLQTQLTFPAVDYAGTETYMEGRLDRRSSTTAWT